MNQKDADDWYEFKPINLPMSKKKRIAILEKQVADLQARLLALEARPVVPVSPTPWTQPWTPGTGNPPFIPTITC